MDLPEVEAFLILAEELHFARTAERLLLSPSRVSKLISSLEHEVGGTLFERTTRRVTLTPLGASLAEQLAPGYSQLHSALEAAQRSARAAVGSLRVGFTSTTGGEPLTDLISRFEARYPECEVILREATFLDPYTPLRSGEIDVLVGWLALGEAEADLIAGPAIDYQERVLGV
ncbi:MAG: LysR family transcriptional regulator, partial [Solirubrobacteraceae bacterium]